MPSDQVRDQVAYIRQQITVGDVAFNRSNCDWNRERPGHLLECLTLALRLLDMGQFARFHADYQHEFNAVGEQLTAATNYSQHWFDQSENIEICKTWVDRTIILISAILVLLEEV